MVVTATVFFLATVHAHGGEETFTSPAALTYHLPMTALFLALLGLFIVVERRVAHPFVEFRHFREKYFSLAITSNTMFHFSMLGSVYPGAPDDRRGQGTDAYLCDPGHAAPPVLRSVYADSGGKHPRTSTTQSFCAPACMASIALGFVMLGLFAQSLSVWFMPLLLLPISLGTNTFNTINNATVMSTLPGGTSRVCVGGCWRPPGTWDTPWGQPLQQLSWRWCCRSLLLP